MEFSASKSNAVCQTHNERPLAVLETGCDFRNENVGVLEG